MPLRAVLFDLDDTLFDHDHSTRRALAALAQEETTFACWTAEEFRTRHNVVLEALHGDVIGGRVSIAQARGERFRRLLSDALNAPAPDDWSLRLADFYRTAYQAAWQPVQGAVDLVATLRAEGLQIGIVTNALRAEQEQKLQRCGLEALVDVMITAEETGTAKPDPAIFAIALERLALGPADVAMVGDAWSTDIEGALAAGIRPVWFNWRREAPPAPEIAELRSLEPTDHAARTICLQGITVKE